LRPGLRPNTPKAGLAKPGLAFGGRPFGQAQGGFPRAAGSVAVRAGAIPGSAGAQLKQPKAGAAAKPGPTPLGVKRKLGEVTGPKATGPAAKLPNLTAQAGGFPRTLTPSAGVANSGPKAPGAAAARLHALGLRPNAKATPGSVGFAMGGAKPRLLAVPKQVGAGTPNHPPPSGKAPPKAAPVRPGATPLRSAVAGARPAGPKAAGFLKTSLKTPGATVTATALAQKKLSKERTIEALCKQLMDEWMSTAKDKKEEGLNTICASFIKRLPEEYLEMMKDKLLSGAVGDASGSAGGEAAKGSEPPAAEEAAETAGEEAAEAAEEKPKVVPPGPKAITAAGSAGPKPVDGERFAQAMKDLLKTVSSLGDAEAVQAWSKVAPAPKDHLDAFVAWFEAAMKGAGGASGAEDAARLPALLLDKKTVGQTTPIEDALKALADKIEDYVQDNETAWHLYGHVLTSLFPKTPSTSWGLLRPGWNWAAWWRAVTGVLDRTNQFRAFDIFVMVLQRLQAKSEVPIKDQPVWKEGGRTAKARQALGKWAEMDDADIVETLKGYSVEV